MTKYLDPEKDDPELLWKDYPEQDGPEDVAQAIIRRCPRCQGHGGWNMEVDCYKSDIPAHRHFRSMCTACNGWGYLQEGQTCAHRYRAATAHELQDFYKRNHKLYKCEHLWVCDECLEERVVDSSD